MSTCKIVTKVVIEIRPDGLYWRTNQGSWRRAGKRLSVMTVAFRGGRLQVSEIPIPKSSDGGRSRSSAQLEVAEDCDSSPAHVAGTDVGHAARIVANQLEQREGIVDLTGRRQGSGRAQSLDQADGYEVQLPGGGRVVAVKPSALARWVPGAVPMRTVIDALDSMGLLVRGADGKRTRQVLIGRSRRRFYCFKATTNLAAGACAIKPRLRTPASSSPSSNVESSARRQAPIVMGESPTTIVRRAAQPAWTDDPEPRSPGVMVSRGAYRPFS
jgi:hypothetical protein